MKHSLIQQKLTWLKSYSLLIMFTLVITGYQKSVAQSAQFYQLNFNYDGNIANNSDWGALDLTFTGSPATMYLNLTVDTAWVIENMAVITTGGYGVSQTQRFWFDIGTNGVPVSTINYGLTVSSSLSSKPVTGSFATVDQDSIIIFSSFLGAPVNNNLPPLAVKQVGAAPVAAPQAHQNFPNQEAAINFCFPVGISNSLQFLDAHHTLAMPANDISIATLGTVFGTTVQAGTAPGWPKKKMDHIKAKKLPITTSVVNGPKSIKDIGNEIANGQDVEMAIVFKNGVGHCVCVTSWADLGNGKYQITVAHDTKQGKVGGCKTETSIYNSNNGTWSAALAFGQIGLFEFIIECPVKKNNKQAALLPGAGILKTKSERTNEFMGGQVSIKNLHLLNVNNFAPPALGSSNTYSFTAPASLEISMNNGNTFLPCSTMCSVTLSVTHAIDSAGMEFYYTEMLALSLQGGSLPAGLMIRESPTLPSTGLSTIKPLPGGYAISSFFDVFTELSLDGGQNWSPEYNGNTVMLEADDGITSIPTLSQWGLIVFGLLMFAVMMVFVSKRNVIA